MAAPSDSDGECGNVILPQSVSLDSTQQKEFEQKVKEIKQKFQVPKQSATPGVVYLGHIPRGFFEQEMERFFSQFGKVNKLRLSRSKKTGGSKGYAFIEFAHDEVAKIVVETMNNYLMFEKLLKCEYLPLSKVHPNTFRGCFYEFLPSKAHIRNRTRHNHITAKSTKQTVKRFLKSHKKRSAKLEALGIDYSFQTAESIKDVLKQARKARKASKRKSPGNADSSKHKSSGNKDSDSREELSEPKEPPKQLDLDMDVQESDNIFKTLENKIAQSNQESKSEYKKQITKSMKKNQDQDTLKTPDTAKKQTGVKAKSESRKRTSVSDPDTNKDDQKIDKLKTPVNKVKRSKLEAKSEPPKQRKASVKKLKSLSKQTSKKSLTVKSSEKLRNKRKSV